MSVLRSIIDRMIIIVNPMWWIMNNGYNKEWDRKLNDLMKSYKFVDDGDGYHTTLGGHRLWIQNYPYASFLAPSSNFSTRVRPSRLTIMRAKRKMKNDTLSVQERRDIILRKLL